MKLFLGIDGGQSSTTALIGDDTGRVLGYGRSGPCNHVAAHLGREKFRHAIGGCLDQACAQAGLSREEVRFAAAVGGFSGGAEDKEAYFRELIPSDQYEITIDPVVALAGANNGAPAIITIGGTGSISYGRNHERKFARAGGWGYVFGDEGGGFDLTRQALRACLRAEEGWGPPTALRDVLLSETGTTSANALLHKFYTPDFPRPQIAALSRLVDQSAINGDLVARNLLHAAAQELATFTFAVYGQLFTEGEDVFVAHIGGVFKSAIVLERFKMLTSLKDGVVTGPPKHGPAAGALIEAYALDGLTPPLTNLPEFEK